MWTIVFNDYYKAAINQPHLNSTGFPEQVSVVTAGPIQLETCTVIKSDTWSILTPQTGSSCSVSCRFLRSGLQCACPPLFVLWAVLALSREFLRFVFMTGNAHHKSLISAYISAGNWLVGWKTTLSRSHKTCKDINILVYSKRRLKCTHTHTHHRQAPEGLEPRERPLAPAHASVQAQVNVWPFD